MGRGRGKGKKLTAVTSNEDPGSGGEEPLPAYRRRGRPQKPLMDDNDEEVAEKIEEEGDKPFVPIKEMKAPAMENGKKRKRNSLVKENSNLESEGSGRVIKTNAEKSTTTNGYRKNGNRRKSKPRRAAEAGVIC